MLKELGGKVREPLIFWVVEVHVEIRLRHAYLEATTPTSQRELFRGAASASVERCKGVLERPLDGYDGVI